MGSNPVDAGAPLKRTPLYDLHVEAGAKMVPFAGYEMPVQYPMGVLKEHLWTREKAGLFDVSHMGVAVLQAQDGEWKTTAAALETVVPADILNLAPNQMRYTQLLATDGGIVDDLMVLAGGPEDNGHLVIVVNASRGDVYFALLHQTMEPRNVRLEIEAPNYGLLALQGPKAAEVMAVLSPQAADLDFMHGGRFNVAGHEAMVMRSGYTGEDGFEISVPPQQTEALARSILSHSEVALIGLGARDSLRLEAGLCLYGHDIDETTSPIEASLAWSIQKRRRIEGGFPGAARIQRELKDAPARRRVGIRPEGRTPAREGTEVRSIDGTPIGAITSGGFGPTVNGPIAMGYVNATHAAAGTQLTLIVRDKPLPARVVDLPFVPRRFHRKAKV